jgi:hypothetical protein
MELDIIRQSRFPPYIFPFYIECRCIRSGFFNGMLPGDRALFKIERSNAAGRNGKVVLTAAAAPEAQ